MRLALLTGVAFCSAAFPAMAQVAPPLNPPGGPQFPPVRLGCGELVQEAVACSGNIATGINYQEVGNLAMTLDASAQVSGGLRIGNTRIVIGPGGSRFEFAATGIAKIDMQDGSGVTNSNGTGIFVASQRGVDIVAQDLTASGQWGIRALSFGPVKIHQLGDINLTTTEGYSGISAQSSFDSVQIVNDGNIAVRGNQAAGILAISGTGSESAAGSIHAVNNGVIRMIGAETTGVVGIIGTRGIVSLVNNGAIETSLYGMLASSARDGAYAQNNGAITTNGDQGHGIWSRSLTADVVALNGDAGRIVTGGDDAVGILVTHEANLGADTPPLLGAFNLGSIETAGRQADGMAAVSALGSVALLNHGTIATRGERANGMSVYSAVPGGAIAVLNAGSIATSGPDAVGIFVQAQGNSITIDAPGTILTSGQRSHGISFKDSGAGSLALTAGDIKAFGQAADAVHLQSNGGDLNVAVRGQVTAATGHGLLVDAGVGTAAINIAEGASVQGSLGAIHILSAASDIQIDGRLGQRGFRAIEAEGGPSTISVRATGVLQGSLAFGGAADSLRNGGILWLDGQSDFGAGDDWLLNSGLVRASGGPVNVIGLERFDNRGLVSLVDGDPTGVLNLGQAAWNGVDGNRIAFDIGGSKGDLLADRLRVGTVTGTTGIILSRAGGSLPLGHQVQIVESSGPISKGAFVLDTRAIGPGFVAYRLSINDKGLSVSAVPGPAVHQAAQASASLTESWRQGVDVWLASRRQSLIAGPEQHFRSWSRLTADNGSTRGGGTQSGAEYLFGRFAAGMAGGYSARATSFRGDVGSLQNRIVDAGAYLVWTGRGGWFASGLAKVDRADVEMRLDSAAFDAKTAGVVYGLLVEGGVRTDLAGFNLEPRLSFARSSTSLDQIDDREARLDYTSAPSMTGRIGMTLTAPKLALGSAEVTPQLELTAEREFKDAVLMRFESDGSSVRVRDSRSRNRGRAQFSADVRIAPGVGAFVVGDLELGSEAGASTGAGLHIAW